MWPVLFIILVEKSKAIYPAGGPTGDMLEQLLEKEGIYQYRIKVKNWTRENVSIIEETTNNQYRFEMPGSPLDEHETDTIIRGGSK